MHSGRLTVLAAAALLAVVASGGAAQGKAASDGNSGSPALAGSPFRSIAGATCLNAPQDPATVPVCYTASAAPTFEVVLTRRAFDRLGGVAWVGGSGLSVRIGACHGRALVACTAAVSVRRPQLLAILPGGQTAGVYGPRAVAYVYIDLATPPVPSEPQRLEPFRGVLLTGRSTTPGVTPEADWVAALRILNRVQGLPPFRLPHGFDGLTPAEQLFVLVNLERTVRGLVPYYGLSTPLDQYVKATVEGHGPPLPPGALDVAEAGVSDPARALFQWLSSAQPADAGPSCSRAHPEDCSVAQNVLLQHPAGLAGMFDTVGAVTGVPVPGVREPVTALGAATHGPAYAPPPPGQLVYAWAQATKAGARPAR